MSSQGEEPPTIHQRRPPGRTEARVLPDVEPPTVLQRSPAATDPPTVYQRRPPGQSDDAPRSPGTTAGSDEPPTTLQRQDRRREPSSLEGVLGELADRFTPVPGGDARLGSGAEAEVWLVRELESDRRAALKIYRPDPQLEPREVFDTDLRERLADPALRRHVPELHGWGFTRDAFGRAVAWEAMEYFPDGSLADLLTREAGAAGRLGPERAAEVVGETVNALVFWEDVVGQRQIDLSPGNILVRSGEPLRLVLSDFSGVRGTGLSQAIGELQVKIGYMAPEALGNGNHARSPYWSLGMITYQMIMGRAVISGRDEDAFRVLLATSDIDVSAVSDPRWRMLIEGLLTRSIDDRWGPDEVRAWLAGDSPQVHRSVRSERPLPSITFAGRQYDDRRLLAGELTSDSDRATQWLRAGGATQLRQWLASFDDRPFDVVHLSGVEGNERNARLAVSWYAAAFTPDLRPHFRGVPVDEDGILRLAQDPGSHAFLHQLVEQDVLRVAALHHCAHEGCPPGGPCVVLRDLSGRISAAATQTMERLTALTVRLAADPLATDIFGNQPLVGRKDARRFFARAAEVLISRERAERIVRTARQGRLPRADWWREIARDVTSADHGEAAGAAAICVAGELLDRATEYRRAEDLRRRITFRQRVSSALGWLGEQFTRNPSGRQRMFAPPRWIARVMWLVLPLGMFEPVYWAQVKSRHLPLDADVMVAGREVMAGLAPYTGWSHDWLTGWLGSHVDGAPWRVFAAYPVVIFVALVVIRRTRRGTAVTSWLAAPATLLGVLFMSGLVMHLLAQNLYVIWATVAALGVGAFVAPALTLIALRAVGGRP
jgi:hypothetical protein